MKRCAKVSCESTRRALRRSILPRSNTSIDDGRCFRWKRAGGFAGGQWTLARSPLIYQIFCLRDMYGDARLVYHAPSVLNPKEPKGRISHANFSPNQRSPAILPIINCQNLAGPRLLPEVAARRQTPEGFRDRSCMRRSNAGDCCPPPCLPRRNWRLARCPPWPLTAGPLVQPSLSALRTPAAVSSRPITPPSRWPSHPAPPGQAWRAEWHDGCRVRRVRPCDGSQRRGDVRKSVIRTRWDLHADGNRRNAFHHLHAVQCCRDNAAIRARSHVRQS